MTRTSYELAAARELRQLTVLYMRRDQLGHGDASAAAVRAHKHYLRGSQWAVADMVAARELPA